MQEIESSICREEETLSSDNALKSVEAAETADNGPNDANPTADKLLELVLFSLDEDKAEDVVSIPLAGKSSIADYMVVASGRSNRQVSAIAHKLLERLKDTGRKNVRSEGLEQGDWALIDIGDVIVHVFRPEVREFYNLEKMWSTPPAATASRS